MIRARQASYTNPGKLDFGDYAITTVKIDGNEISIDQNSSSAILPRNEITALSEEHIHEIVVELGAAGK